MERIFNLMTPGKYEKLIYSFNFIQFQRREKQVTIHSIANPKRKILKVDNKTFLFNFIISYNRKTEMNKSPIKL
jgi:hypothetical protein